MTSDSGTGWRIREQGRANQGVVPEPPVLAPPAPPLPALVHGTATALTALAPPPVAPPPLAPRTAPPPGTPVRFLVPKNKWMAIGMAVVLIVVIAGGGFFLFGRSAATPLPLSTLPQEKVAVVNAGPAQLAMQSLTGGASTRTVTLPGAPNAILETPDRSKAFLLDTNHGDVIPVDLVSGTLGKSIPVGKLPVDEQISADGTTLYVTDNLGGTVIPINTATDRLEPAQPLSRGVAYYVPSPTGSGALVGADTPPGQPGVIYFYNPSTGNGAPVEVGSNPAQSAFYSSDGKTVWIIEPGANSHPGALIPVDVATHKSGTAIALGIAPTAYGLTPNRQTVVITNRSSSTLSIVDLVKRAVVATVPLAGTPTGVAIDATGSIAWVAATLNHELIPVHLQSHVAAAAVSLPNAPGDLALPAAAGVAWVLYPSSNGSLSFLGGSAGPVEHTIPVGNDPDLLIGTGSESSWVANSLDNTVEPINYFGQSAGKPIAVDRAPVDLKLTADGSSVLVLSYGDGVHPGALSSINAATLKVSAPIAVGPGPGDLTLSPAGDVAFIASYRTNTISVVDLTNWKLKRVIPLPCGPTNLAITPDASQLFVGCADSSAIVPIKLPDYSFETPVAVPSLRSLVMPEAGTSLLVVGDNSLQTLDTITDKITKTVRETGNLVDVVETSDAGTIIAIDNSGAALLVIDPVTLATTKSLSVGVRPDQIALAPDDAHAYVLDTSQRKLYVIDVTIWKIDAALTVSANATAVTVPPPVVIPPN
jgi:YVTN family beta-propeller protein